MATATTSTPALDRLRPEEQAGLLPALLAAHPELIETLEALALARVRDVDVEEIARDLERRLEDLPSTELAARAGKQPGSYVHAAHAASEIVAEALASFEHELWRAAALDLPDVDRTVLLGIVTGLHRCCDASDAPVLAHAGPETPLEHASWLVREARATGVELDPGEVESLCPGWILLADGLWSA